ncbi:MAG: peptidylprolyl isomerase [Nitrospirae bacterium]|nr:peptidylprolyl isomerase [Nitrospirota bacterium]
MEVKNGDKVKVHYTLKDANGDTIETSKGIAPIEFTVGEGMVIPGFEKGVTGMKPNETKRLTLSPEDSYGLRDENKVFEFARKSAPGDFDPRIGDTIKMHRADGRSVPVTVAAITDKGFMMDANHPLAGKELIFELELIEIVPTESKLTG